jgi:hypothetical protein
MPKRVCSRPEARNRVEQRLDELGCHTAAAHYGQAVRALGRTLAFSAADAGTDGRSLVFVRDVATGETTLVSRAAGPRGASADADAHARTPGPLTGISAGMDARSGTGA